MAPHSRGEITLINQVIYSITLCVNLNLRVAKLYPLTVATLSVTHTIQVDATKLYEIGTFKDKGIKNSREQ